jgi:hypothetical protein
VLGDKEAGDKEAGDKEAGDKEAGDKEAGDKEAGDKEAGNFSRISLRFFCYIRGCNRMEFGAYFLFIRGPNKRIFVGRLYSCWYCS